MVWKSQGKKVVAPEENVFFPPLQDSAYGSLATSQYHRSTGSSSKSRESNLRCRFLFALTQD